MAELAGYDTSKGTIRFQPSEGLPARLVRKIVRSRVRATGGQRERHTWSSDSEPAKALP
jgi:uncharacterized protein YdhG (YjbR/CyaY superfamily)